MKDVRKGTRAGKRRRLTQFAGLVAVFGGLWLLGLDPRAVGALVWAAMQAVAGWSQENVLVAAGAYLLATAATKIVPFTGGGAVLILGGFLFGAALGGVLAASGATLSALIVFLLGRRLLSDLILDRWGDRFARIEERILEYGFSYYLALRLLPMLPAWFVNLVPVIVPLRLRTVLVATFLGLLPLSFIMAGLGESLSDVTAREERLSVALRLDSGVILPLAALSLLALIPPALPWLFARRRGRKTGGTPPRTPASGSGG